MSVQLELLHYCLWTGKWVFMVHFQLVSNQIFLPESSSVQGCILRSFSSLSIPAHFPSLWQFLPTRSGGTASRASLQSASASASGLCHRSSWPSKQPRSTLRALTRPQMETWLFDCAVPVEFYRTVTLKGDFSPFCTENLLMFNRSLIMLHGPLPVLLWPFSDRVFSFSVLKIRVHASVTKRSKGIEFLMRLYSADGQVGELDLYMEQLIKAGKRRFWGFLGLLLAQVRL